MYQYKHMISPIFYTIWQNVSPQFPKTDVHIFYVKSDSTDVSLLFSTVNCRDVGDLDCQRQQQKLVISQWIREMSGLLMSRACHRHYITISHTFLYGFLPNSLRTEALSMVYWLITLVFNYCGDAYILHWPSYQHL